MDAVEAKTSWNSDVSNLLANVSQTQKVLSFVTRNVNKYKKKDDKSLADLIGRKKIISEIETKIHTLYDGEIKNIILMWVESERNIMDALNTKLQSEFAMELYNELQLNDMKLISHMPKLKTSFYNLDIDFEKNLCKLSYGLDSDHIANLKINPKDISEYIVKMNKELDKQFGNGKSFKKYLVEANKNITARTSIKGGKASIIDVLLEISFLKQGRKFRSTPSRKNYTTYSRIQFSYDIYRLINDHPKDIRIKLSTATRAQARNKSNYLWIPKNSRGEGSIYSHIEMVRN